MLVVQINQHEINIQSHDIQEMVDCFDWEGDWYVAIDMNGEVWAFDQHPVKYGDDHWDSPVGPGTSVQVGRIEDQLVKDWEEQIVRLEPLAVQAIINSYGD